MHSFAGDPPIACRAYVRAALGLEAWERGLGRSSWGWSRRRTVAEGTDSATRSALALRLWKEAHDPRGTIVEGYLASRDLTLSEDIPGEVIRFHPTLRFDGELVGGMVALFRDITSNEPCGILRTFLDGAGRKRDRRMLGRTKNAAIKLDADENVTLGLIIGEGLETSLAAQLATATHAPPLIYPVARCHCNFSSRGPRV